MKMIELMRHIWLLNFLLPIVLLAVAGIMCAKRPEDKRWDGLLLMGALILPAQALVYSVVLQLTRLVQVRYDLYLFAFDRFFDEPSFKLGHYLAVHSCLGSISGMAYGLLSTFILTIWVIYRWNCGTRETIQIVRTFILNDVLAVPLYLLIPASGPKYAFNTFPSLPADFSSPHTILLSFPPNAIPSVHTSTALLILYFARKWPLGIGLALAHLFLVFVSTLGLGEHYLFDLIVALPYSALIIWLGKNPEEPTRV